MDNKKSKYDRILTLYERLNSGGIINKVEEAYSFSVSERTIQRDIDDIRAFFDNDSYKTGCHREVVYDAASNGYMIKSDSDKHLNEKETLAVCKILLDNRSLSKREMMAIIDKLKNYAPERCKKEVAELINSEKFHYCQPRHGKDILDILWDMGVAVVRHNIVEVEYCRKYKTKVKRRLKPVGIMAADLYFYFAAFIDDIDKQEHFKDPDDISPTIYRIDRITKVKNTGENFVVPYKDRFSDGEFKKRIQYMFGGPLKAIRFSCDKVALEAVLDKLPTAEIKEQKEGVFIIEAETFGNGAQMWLRTQDDKVKMLNID